MKFGITLVLINLPVSPRVCLTFSHSFYFALLLSFYLSLSPVDVMILGRSFGETIGMRHTLTLTVCIFSSAQP